MSIADPGRGTTRPTSPSAGRALHAVAGGREPAALADLPDPQDWRTVKTVDARGYRYNSTSPEWKAACEALPCFPALTWPGYETAVIERKINGVDAVIQLWRGRCQQFLGLEDFPGGIGAEVGIYRRHPAAQLPTELPFLDDDVARLVLAQVDYLAGDDVWWAAPELETTLRFELINPVNGEVVFATGPETSYWLNKWMYDEDYEQYAAERGVQNMPLSASHLQLNFSIDDEPFQPWPHDTSAAIYDLDAYRVARDAWNALLNGWD